MLLADHLLEGDGHMIRGKALDYSAFGRTLLRRDAGQSAVELEAVCDQLAALLPERAAELTALKKHIEGTGAPYSLSGQPVLLELRFHDPPAGGVLHFRQNGLQPHRGYGNHPCREYERTLASLRRHLDTPARR